MHSEEVRRQTDRVWDLWSLVMVVMIISWIFSTTCYGRSSYRMLHVLMQFIDKILTFMCEVTDIYTWESSASTIGCQCRPSVSKTKYFISGRWCSKIHQGWFRLHIPSIRAFRAIRSRTAIDNNRLASSEGPAKNRSLHKTKAWLIIAA